MSSTTQYTDFSDLYSGLLNAVHEQTGVTATESQAKRYINVGLVDMHLGFGEKFHWCERSTVLRTQQRYTTGEVAVTRGSTTVTGTDTLWDTNNDFSVKNARSTGKLVLNGTEPVYKISSVDSDTQITLATPYVGEDATEASYVYFEDEYDLHADFLRPFDLQRFDTRGNIDLISTTEFRRRVPRTSATGDPVAASIINSGFSGSTALVRRVQFHPPPADFSLIPYSFVTNKLAVASDGTEQTQLSADDDEPTVPLGYRHAVLFHALWHWYRDKKNDTRSAEVQQQYTDVVLRITADTEIGGKRPQIAPRVGPYVRSAKRPYSGGSSRYVLGSRFDQLR